jgi:hypothetical protein
MKIRVLQTKGKCEAQGDTVRIWIAGLGVAQRWIWREAWLGHLGREGERGKGGGGRKEKKER